MAMTKGERDQLISLVRRRAKQAEREAEAREKVLLAEVQEQLTAQFAADDALWADAVKIAKEAEERANAHIRACVADLGIPPQEAPRLQLGWQSRGESYANPRRRAELRKLAETRLAALTKTAKAAIGDKLLAVETDLIAGALQSSDAQNFLAAMPTAEQLMPPLGVEDLGVKRWQPPEDAATQLTTPLSPAQRLRRRVLRTIEANPGASDRRIAELAGCDHKTVARYRRGEIPALTGEVPRDEGTP